MGVQIGSAPYPVSVNVGIGSSSSFVDATYYACKVVVTLMNNSTNATAIFDFGGVSPGSTPVSLPYSGDVSILRGTRPAESDAALS
jgi:hypothetical protein